MNRPCEYPPERRSGSALALSIDWIQRWARASLSVRMKITTFNINNIKRRLQNLLDWLRAAEPDVVCLQELKVTDAEFPIAEIQGAGYEAVWHGQKSWNGVAILARHRKPVLTRTELPGDPRDTEARYIESAVNGILIGCIYLPNGNPSPGSKFEYKSAWFKRLISHAAELRETRVPVILAGDYNVVPTAFDIYPTKSWDNDALLHPEIRAAFRHLLNQGWIDAIRARHPDVPMYTYWDYKRNRWVRDAGLRLDHILLSPDLAEHLVDAGVDRDVRGREAASDHAPAWVMLRSTAQMPRTWTDRGPKEPAATTSQRPAVAAATSGRRKSTAERPWVGRAIRRRPLLVIDGDSFAHRSYHALPNTILRRGNKGAGAIVGFANLLLRLYEAEHPRSVLVAWDTLEVPTYRHEKFAAYQSGRTFDDALLEQLAVLPEFVAACGFVNAKAPGFEADDFLAAAVGAEERRGGTTLVASGDRDTFQLASPATTILFPVRAGEMARIGPAEVRERYGVDPKQVPDFIALRGDPSDKLPGAPGVGPKGAADLIRRYGSLEAMLAAGRFPAQAEMLRLFRSIATMDPSAPLPPIEDHQPSWANASDLARAWDLNRLADRLAKMTQTKRA
jgi:exodeoxyribonuclease III